MHDGSVYDGVNLSSDTVFEMFGIIWVGVFYHELPIIDMLYNFLL